MFEQCTNGLRVGGIGVPTDQTLMSSDIDVVGSNETVKSHENSHLTVLCRGAPVKIDSQLSTNDGVVKFDSVVLTPIVAVMQITVGSVVGCLTYGIATPSGGLSPPTLESCVVPQCVSEGKADEPTALIDVYSHAVHGLVPQVDTDLDDQGYYPEVYIRDETSKCSDESKNSFLNMFITLLSPFIEVDCEDPNKCYYKEYTYTGISEGVYGLYPSGTDVGLIITKVMSANDDCETARLSHVNNEGSLSIVVTNTAKKT